MCSTLTYPASSWFILCFPRKEVLAHNDYILSVMVLRKLAEEARQVFLHCGRVSAFIYQWDLSVTRGITDV